MKYIKLTLIFFLSIGLMSATLHRIVLVTKTILNDKVEIGIPEEFEIMKEEHLKVKYPSNNRPTIVYTDKSTQFNVAFNHTKTKARQSQLDDFRNSFNNEFLKTYPDAKWISDGVKEINGRQVGYIELVTPAADMKIYNLIFFTDVDGKLLLCTFNCPENYSAHWSPSAKEMLHSLKVK